VAACDEWPGEVSGGRGSHRVPQRAGLAQT